MKKILLILLCLVASPVAAQQVVTPCVETAVAGSVPTCRSVSAAAPLPAAVYDAGNNPGYIYTSNGSGSPATFQGNVTAMLSTALISGGALSIHSGDATKFDIAPLVAQFVNNSNPQAPVITNLNFAGISGVSVTDLTKGATFISMDKNGSIHQTYTFPNDGALRSNVNLGALVISGGVISSVDIFSTVPATNIAASIADLGQAIGAINESGNVFSGDATQLMKLDKSSGQFVYPGINWVNDPTNPNVLNNPTLTAPTFLYTWRDGSGGWVVVATDTILPQYYDDGTGGVSHPNGSVGASQWTDQTIYYSPDANTVIVQYGQALYSSLSTAQSGISKPILLNPSFAAVPFRSWLIMQQTTTSLSDTLKVQFLDAGKFGLTTSGSVGSTPSNPASSAITSTIIMSNYGGL